MRLETMTWPEVDGTDRDTVVVVPFAAVEQHGPHLPLFTDSAITHGILELLEARDPTFALWLPVQRIGSSPHHLPFVGTLTLTSRTFLDVVTELVASIAEHGFHNFVLLNGHGGNQALLDVALQEIRLRQRTLRLIHVTYWNVARQRFGEIRTSAPGGMGHAGEMETSIMLALHPETVRTDLCQKDGETKRSTFDHEDMLAPSAVGQFRFWDERSRKGVLGDPTTASAEKGRRFLDAAADGVLEAIRDVQSGKLG